MTETHKLRRKQYGKNSKCAFDNTHIKHLDLNYYHLCLVYTFREHLQALGC